MADIQAITEKIKAHLAARAADPTPSKIPHTFKFYVTKDGATVKIVFLDLVNFTASSDDKAADVTVTLEAEYAKKIFLNEIDAVEAYKAGHAKIEGDKDLLLKLKPFLAKFNSA